MSIHGGVFLNTLRNFRLTWIGGRYGGGKTALAVRLAYEFIERGWVKQAIGNFPCVLFTDLRQLADLRDTFIILDEAGVWMTEKSFDSAVAYLRKRNLYLVMPSVLAPPTRARTFNIMRVINGNAFALPFWTYSGSLSYMQVKDKYSLVWFNPHEVYGLWDTSHVAVDDEGIISVIKETFSASGSSPTPPAAQDETLHDGDGGNGLEEMRRLSESLYESSQAITDSLSVHERLARRRRGRR